MIVRSLLIEKAWTEGNKCQADTSVSLQCDEVKSKKKKEILLEMRSLNSISRCLSIVNDET